jgi:hypothetical protein
MPRVSILPCVLERAVAPRHMLPFGKQDRPIYAETSLPSRWRRAKENCDLVPFDFPGNGFGLCASDRAAVSDSRV